MKTFMKLKNPFLLFQVIGFFQAIRNYCSNSQKVCDRVLRVVGEHCAGSCLCMGWKDGVGSVNDTCLLVEIR